MKFNIIYNKFMFLQIFYRGPLATLLTQRTVSNLNRYEKIKTVLL